MEKPDDGQILWQYQNYRESIGRPRTGPEDMTQSVVFAAFKAAYCVGFWDSCLIHGVQETVLPPDEGDLL